MIKNEKLKINSNRVRWSKDQIHVNFSEQFVLHQINVFGIS